MTYEYWGSLFVNTELGLYQISNMTKFYYYQQHIEFYQVCPIIYTFFVFISHPLSHSTMKKDWKEMKKMKIKNTVPPLSRHYLKGGPFWAAVIPTWSHGSVLCWHKWIALGFCTSQWVTGHTWITNTNPTMFTLVPVLFTLTWVTAMFRKENPLMKDTKHRGEQLWSWRSSTVWLHFSNTL